jgi:hypothetical protein
LKILQLRLLNFRGVSDRVVEPKPAGVTVIVAPNEKGKSSLIEGLDLILTELDSSKKRTILLVKPVGRDVGPEVEIELSVPPYRFKYHKRWAKHPLTELHISEPRAEAATGREAHERVATILSEATDLDLFHALQVIQGAGLEQPELFGKGLLTKALDEAAGGIAGREVDSTLINAAEAEYVEYFTAGGDERQALKTLRAEVGSLESKVAVLKQKVSAADNETENHARLRRELASLEEQLAFQRKELDGWEERLAAVSRLKDAQQVALAQATAAREALQRATAAIEARARLIGDLKAQEEALGEARKKAENATAQVRRLRELSESSELKIRAAEQSWNEARALATLRSNDKEKLRVRFDVQLLTERLALARRSEKDLDEAESVLRQNKIADQVLERLRELQTTETVARGRLESSSPRLTVIATADSRPLIDGKTVVLKKGSRHDSSVTDRSVIEFPSLARIEIQAGTSLATLKTKHKEAAEELQSALQQAQVADLPGAVEANRAFSEAQTKRREAQKAIRQALRTDFPEPFADFKELEGKIAELKERIASLERDRPENIPFPKSREEADRLAQSAAGELVDAERNLTALREENRQVQRDFQAASIRAAELVATVDEMTRVRSAQSGRLDDARAAVSDDELSAKVEEARLKAESKSADLTDAETQLNVSDPDVVQARTDSLRGAVKKTQDTLTAKQSKLAEASGRLSQITEEGIFDQLEDSQRNRDAKARELASTERRSRAAKLLFEVLSRHRSAAQRAYLGPLRARVEELGRLVFGATLKVELTEDLSIASRELDGLPIPFESLSKGAQEQLGIIMRLAVAMIVSKDAQGVPVIVDDGLGYTDPERLLGMGAVFDRAGKDCQVIVLTCQPERYAALGDAAVVELAE